MTTKWWKVAGCSHFLRNFFYRNVKVKWVPENLNTFSIAGQVVIVYKFSGRHFIIEWKQKETPHNA